MVEFDRVEDVAAYVISLADKTLIAIDGVANAGKTTLGADLATRISASHIDLDSYLIRDSAAFVSALRFDDLRNAIAAVPGKVVLTGVCMRAVTETLALDGMLHVYVKRMASWGWADAPEVEGNQLEQIMEAIGTGPDDHPLAVEVRDYHRRYLPQNHADVIYQRFE